MRCPFCNTELENGAMFCPNCGQNINGMGGGQPPYTPPYTQPYMQPAPKKKTGVLIAAGAAVAVIAAGGIFAGVTLLKKDPKDVVIDAFKGAYGTDIKYPVEEVFGWEELAKSCRSKNMEGSFSLTLEECADPSVNAFAGTGLTVSSKADMKEKKIAADFETKVANMDFVTMNMYMDKENLAVAIPEISERVFTVNYGDDLAGQIEDSPIMGRALDQAGIDAEALSGYMDYLWSMYDEEGRPFDLEALWERYKEGSKAIDDFKEAMTVEKAEGATYTIDGKEVKCKGYDVVISQEAMIDFVETTSKFFMEDESLKADVVEYLAQMIALSGGQAMGGMSAEDLQKEAWDSAEEYVDQVIQAMEDSVEDITMTVYVDKKGRLAAFEAETSLFVDNEKYDLAMETELKGGSYLSQNEETKMTIKGDGGKITITVSEEGTYDKESLTKAVYVTISDDSAKIKASWDSEYDRTSGDYSMKLSGGMNEMSGDITVDGSISNLKAGESFDISMDNIRIKWNGEQMAALSGSYSLKPLESEITMPEGEKCDILAADEGEWQEIANEAMGNIQSIGNTIGGLISGAVMGTY